MQKWHKERVLLIGDASAAFLPTAGVGASIAMESAAVLNDELARVDTRSVPDAIDLFLKRRRRRVDTIQAQSRLLFKLMSLKPEPLTMACNVLLRCISVDQFFGSITRWMRQPI
ncbi:MAG: FAD-dependent monooxygenase [Ktedonobacteraceae bacterium]|nr:FAD-dependent monooxygenase [Ktedonobacteraceae bacterium]